MILVKPSFEVMEIMRNPGSLQLIEEAGRTCYKSEDDMTAESAVIFAGMRIKQGHESVIEHSAATVRIICDRGVTHELVRHRLASYSQESTRYCNYKGGVTFVIPPWVSETVKVGEYRYGIYPKDLNIQADARWMSALMNAEDEYIQLLEVGWSPQQARSVLPNSLKTEIVVTANFREWRHIFTLRTAKSAHPQMREIMIPLLAAFKERVPVVFAGIDHPNG